MKTIRRVAVLGAGTMGSRIAAHFANAGYPVLLLDIVLPGEADRSSAARRGLETAARQSPGAFFSTSAASLVMPGNFEDDLGKISGCEWIIEAVTENLEIKRKLWQQVAAVRAPESIASTNTSGIPLTRIAEGMSDEFRRNFLGTHFFNPPRYLHLLELIPGPATDPEGLAQVSEFCERKLGKGVVQCKDTPDFIANRIGGFFGATVHKIVQADGYSIEEADAITGSLIGLPNSASFRLLDIVGLDVWSLVMGTVRELAPDDPWRERFQLPEFLAAMIARGWLGDKAGQGFYRKTGKGESRELEVIDWRTLEYHPAAKAKFPEAEQAKRIEDLPQRLRTLVAGDGRVGSFLWKLFRDALIYSAERVPEIANRVADIDRAMRWGYAHKLGPFELWDALGFRETCARMEKDGYVLPPSVVKMLATGAGGFYRAVDNGGVPGTEYFDLLRNRYEGLEERPGHLSLLQIKRARGVVRTNLGASLIDIGDGVLCLEFHSKMNALGEDQLAMIFEGIEEAERNFEALVIANEGATFSAGANLAFMLQLAQTADWEALGGFIRRLQQATMALKYAPKPVVSAPFSRVLGGGCEVVLHSRGVQASAELNIGLVETSVGLIPAAGGCKEMVARFADPRRVFELITKARVSTSADNSKELGLLDAAAVITMNPERLLGDAKLLALWLASSYRPGTPRNDIKVGGKPAFEALHASAARLHEAGEITDHDLTIAAKLAHVITGGNVSGEQPVSEQHLLDLELEAFLSLCGMLKTQERIEHMLKNGKPLRN